MDDYSFLRDLLDTWRATTDWVKAVVLVVVPGYVAFLAWLVVALRRERPAADPLTETRVRQLVEAELCRIVAEWERAKLAELPERRPDRLDGPR